VSWSRRFEEPILLPDGRKLRTLREAINWLAKEVPKSRGKDAECPLRSNSDLRFPFQEGAHPLIADMARSASAWPAISKAFELNEVRKDSG